MSSRNGTRPSPRYLRLGALDLREWIVGPARLSFEIGTLLDGKALVEDVAFHMALPLEAGEYASP